MPFINLLPNSIADLSEVTKALLKEDLKKEWEFSREEDFRIQQKLIWKTTDWSLIVLSDNRGNVGSMAKHLCNKSTAFYWQQSAQVGRDTPEGKICVPGSIFGALFEEWRRCYDFPNFEFGHFLANPVRITPTGPSTIQGIVNAHASLCSQAIELSLSLNHYSVYPMYPAVIIICDRFDSSGRVEPQSDNSISLRDVGRVQSVLVVLTGADSGPAISLKGLAEYALPIERTDVNGFEVVRVPLEIAVRFIVSLENKFPIREANYYCHNVEDKQWDIETPRGYDGKVCFNQDEWAHAMITAAEKHGYKDFSTLQYSLTRVRAQQFGQIAEDAFEHSPFSNQWKP